MKEEKWFALLLDPENDDEVVGKRWFDSQEEAFAFCKDCPLSCNLYLVLDLEEESLDRWDDGSE